MSSLFIWSIVGGVLILGELFTGTFVLLILGLAALLVALLKILGLDNFMAEMGIFSAFSLVAVFLLRNKILKVPSQAGESFEIDKNQTVVASEGIVPNAEGVLNYQGSPWKCHNVGKTPIVAGDIVTLIRVDSNKLIVEKKT